MRVLALLLCSLPLFAGITRDTSNSSGGENVLTWAYTMGSCSNRVLTVFAESATAGGTVSGVTFNGVAMNHVAGADITTSSTRGYVYQLVAAASGTHNIVISTSGGDWFPTAASYCGVDQTTPIDNTATHPASGGTTAPSLAITPGVDKTFAVYAFVGTNFVSINSFSCTGLQNFSNISLLQDSGQITPAASKTCAADTGSTNWGEHAITLTPASVPPCLDTTASLPNWNLGSPYSQTITTSGCTSPTFAVTTGTLAGTGLSLNASTGVLSGTPAVIDNTQPRMGNSFPIAFTVTITDGAGAGNPTQAYSIKFLKVWGY